MKKNVGKTDKLIRLVVALAIAVAYYLKVDFMQGMTGTVLLVIAIILALTSFLNFCPLYSVLGFNTGKD